MEIIFPSGHNNYQFAVFDFDGTLSLIREGWQKIMTPYFAEELSNTPEGKNSSWQTMYDIANMFITNLTGKQTIYQCIALAEEIAKLGGKPEEPQYYKDEYLRRLMEHIDYRLDGLEKGIINPEDLTVPGTYDVLNMLKKHGVTMFLASGTDEENVKKEARLLNVSSFFGTHIYGAQREYKTFSKKMVIERILRENHLPGINLLGFGDGYVEIENIHEVGGYAIGVASNELTREGIDEWKRVRLINAGAKMIIPDYRNINELEAVLFQ